MPLSDDQALYWYDWLRHKAIYLQKPALRKSGAKRHGKPPAACTGWGTSSATFILRLHNRPPRMHPGRPDRFRSHRNMLKHLRRRKNPCSTWKRNFPLWSAWRKSNNSSGDLPNRRAAKKRQAAGHTVDSALYPNLVISGSPGRGKPICCPAGRGMFRHFGYLKTGKTIER